MSCERFLAHYRDSDSTCQSVETHLIETSLLSKRFAGKIGLDLIGELIGLLHDLGKYSSEYQCYIKSAVGVLNPEDTRYLNTKKFKGRIDHSTAGAIVSGFDDHLVDFIEQFRGQKTDVVFYRLQSVALIKLENRMA